MSARVSARLRIAHVERQSEALIVTAHAVYSADPTSPNYSYSKWTPWAELRMAITNPDAMPFFEIGAEIDVLLTRHTEAS